MSDEIEELIANIEQKFDHEFNQKSQHPTVSENEPEQTPSKNIDKDKQNPQSSRTAQKNNNEAAQTTAKKFQTKQSIVIEEEDEHEHQYENENEQKRQQKKDTNEKISKKLEYDGQHKRESKKENGQYLNENQNQNQHEDQEQNGEQDDQNRYKDLSQKLQSALKKISSSKRAFQTHTSISSPSNFYTRAEQYQKKKQKDLQQKRKQQQQKKFTGLKSKPDINPKSKKIAQETSYKPIYQRFDKIVEQKKKKLETFSQQKQQKQQQIYNTYLEQYKKHVKMQPDQCRDSETYFHDMLTWKNKVEKQRQEKIKQNLQKQKEGYTFKPELNKKSVKIMEKNKRVPIQDREIQAPRKADEGECTFQPKINSGKGAKK